MGEMNYLVNLKNIIALNKFKINIVLNSFPRESETFLTYWIDNLIQHGCNVRLILLSESKNKKHNYKFYGVKYTLTKSPLVLMEMAWLVFKGNTIKTAYYTSLFGYGKPDLVHFAYTSIPVVSLDSLINLKKLGLRLLVSCRGHSENVRPYITSGRKEQLQELFNIVDKVHCVAKEMENRMISDFGLDSSKSFVNEPAIHIDRFKFKQKTKLSNKLVVITNGRLVSAKGYVFSLLAIRRLISDGIDIEYRIIGSGSERDNILFYLDRLNLTKHVLLLGGLEPSEVIKEISNADIFVACTLSEGLSNAVIESMAVGTPVISTNVNGMPEVVDDGINGILVNPYSDFEIYSGIKRLTTDLELYVRFSIEGRKKVEEKFNINMQNKIFIHEYLNLLVRV
jgi:glycosyltransferase involved in cell wall biosynthesis